MPLPVRPCINYTIKVGGGDRSIVYRASTISLTDIQGEKPMNNKLWQEVVNDYYKEANYYLGVEA